MIVATRILTLRQDAGDASVAVRIHAPEPDDRCWRCRYEIEWPGRPVRLDACGADAAQAMLLAFEIVGAHLYSSAEHKSGRLFWDEPGKGYGFPVAKGLRDLLVGLDRRFYGNDP